MSRDNFGKRTQVCFLPFSRSGLQRKHSPESMFMRYVQVDYEVIAVKLLGVNVVVEADVKKLKWYVENTDALKKYLETALSESRVPSQNASTRPSGGPLLMLFVHLDPRPPHTLHDPLRIREPCRNLGGFTYCGRKKSHPKTPSRVAPNPSFVKTLYREGQPN
jgi:hypothetical protein